MNISRAHLSAILAFSCWGLFPLFWKIFSEVGPWDLFGHRLIFSFITLTVIMGFRKELPRLLEIAKTPKTCLLLVISAILISTNWLLYIYAINIGKVLEASMGYFLNPLINVFMGWLILKEKIRFSQWPSIILAVIAMVLIGMQNLDHFPWLALTLSITFALYGLIRKLAQVGSLEGLTFETWVVIIPVLICWGFQDTTPLTILSIVPAWKIGLISLSGFVTCLPLVLFAYSTRRLTMQALGFIQYLSPSLKFICGLYILHEPLSQDKLQAFFVIWIALAWYTLESFYHVRKIKKNIAILSE